MLSNAYFLAKFRFDTAENEPAKHLQTFRKKKNAFFENAFFENASRDDRAGRGPMRSEWCKGDVNHVGREEIEILEDERCKGTQITLET